MPNKVQAAEVKQAKKPVPHAPASPAKIAGQLQHTQQSAVPQIQPQAGLDPRLLTPDNLLQLQRTLGNRAVGKLLSGGARPVIQAKLTVGAAHDAYEQEADRVADQVMQAPVPTLSSMQKSPDPEEDQLQAKPLAATLTPLAQRTPAEEDKVQTKATSATEEFEAGTDFEQRLSAARSGGVPLSEQTRAFMEPCFGADFSSVRLHTGSDAAQLNRAVSAQAFTQGQDIYLGAGHENVESSAGQRLLAHELTHVVQQTGAAVQRSPQLSRPFNPAAVQRKIGFEFEVGGIKTEHKDRNEEWVSHKKGDVISNEPGYNITADISEKDSQLEFVTDQFDETQDDAPDEIARVAKFIKEDMKQIVAAANARHGMVLASDIAGLKGGNRDRFLPQLKNYLHLAGQLQMTGGVKVGALAGIVSGSAMPKRKDGPPDTRYQDFAIYYKDIDPADQLQQPIFQAAIEAVNSFVGQADAKRGGLPGAVRGALAAVITLMAQIPLNMRGALPPKPQGLFLARTDYAKILKMIGDDSGIDIDPTGFTQALLSTINQFIHPALKQDDDVFPAAYKSAGQQLTGVSLGQWARSVVPTPGKVWGRWQGTDLITKQNFPGTSAQKAELRAFGGFGGKTDPGNKLILEWRNLQMMYADQLELVMTGLAEYLRQANK